MNAVIKISSVSKEFRQDQLQILRRITMVLKEHDLSVELEVKQKKSKHVRLRAV